MTLRLIRHLVPYEPCFMWGPAAVPHERRLPWAFSDPAGDRSHVKYFQHLLLKEKT